MLFRRLMGVIACAVCALVAWGGEKRDAELAKIQQHVIKGDGTPWTAQR